MSLAYFLIVLSILVLVHEFGHYIAAKSLGVAVEKFSFGFGPKIFSIKRGGTEYLISMIPLGGYVKMAGDDPAKELTHEGWEFLSRKASERFKIIFAGPFLNYILGFLIFSIIFMFGSPTLTTEVGGLLKDYPAMMAGVLVGDKITAVDGRGVRYWDDVTEAIHKRVEESMRLSIERRGKLFDLEVRPIVKRTKDIFGKEVRIALIGITPSQKIEKVRYGILESVHMGFKKLLQLTTITYKALWSMMIGRLSMRESMTGPIGIFIITGQAAKLGLIYIFHLMGLLSVSLAIFNLLPFPVLDGGHVLFLILERLRGRPLSVRTQEFITNTGILILILFTVFVFYSDMTKFGMLKR